MVIFAVTAGVALAAPHLPGSLSAGRLVLSASALLLGQSLVRDVWILTRTRPGSAGETREARCMCIESTLGLSGALAGAILVLVGNARPIEVSPMVWTLGVLGVLLIGYGLRDWVFTWRPFRLMRDRDHVNVIVRWK